MIPKQATAAIRSTAPIRSPGRPVTIPTIATDIHATAISANTAASTRMPPIVARARFVLSCGANERSVHLHDLQALPPVPAGQGGHQRHLPVVHAGREDRRPRLQRRRQVDAAADHGRSRHRIRWTGPARTQGDRRAPRPGARARSLQGCPRQRRGRRRGGTGAARPLQRALDELLRRDRRRVRARAGADRRRRRLESRHDARVRDGCAALPAGRRRRDQAVRRRAPPGRALPAAAAASPTCCCSTSRRTTSTPSRSPGSSSTSTTTRARSSRSPTIATSSTTSPAGSSSSIAAAASRIRATTPAGWSRNRFASPRRSVRSPAASGRSRRSSSGCG